MLPGLRKCIRKKISKVKLVRPEAMRLKILKEKKLAQKVQQTLIEKKKKTAIHGTKARPEIMLRLI